ncbi:tRNA (N6-threonylcarbamoyladenosine(37)-N6)-methyltransferase TrmO [Propylenella binzhouense]|uniref:tRNA (N6-threonylcarbamoyladenosine(37)-N6)-methyltransferase TrmO n=1 Tax=Propylenella binzhouense TaxID=2555902 RepID=A0A964T264_9HYPH|nr:tRNA (N6-threonylcarbamoyladenosine(37)-N6)-methyltransferase TrmO [Propylenella binzhouense]MYZ47096.1 tRNA (N6-threonylcarbamoyladenosine(37)-N6)-methyltransferase TrmO [Propylenella binzhouense]
MDDQVREGEIALPFDPAECADDAALVFIGRARTPWRARGECPHNPREARERGGDAVLEIDAPWRPGLRDIKAGDRIIVLYWMDKARRDLVVQVPRHRGLPVGTFSLRSPVRPNPIALSVTTVLSSDPDAGILRVGMLDCLDGTPLLDIKPWLESIDVPPAA